MSMRPGATILPRASMVSAASAVMLASTAAMRRPGDRHVAHGVEPQCGIDDTPTLDNAGRSCRGANMRGAQASTAAPEAAV